jgi:preprotein translocase subunit SecD
MFKTLRGRLVTILIVMGFAGWQLYDHYRNSCPESAPESCIKRPLTLGLDLQGGMHLVLEVDDPEGTMTDDAKVDMIDRVERIIRTRIDEFGVSEPLVQKASGGQRLIVELAGITDEDRAKGIVQESAFLEFKFVVTSGEVQSSLQRIDRAIVASLGVDSIRAMGRDITSGGENVEDLLFGGGADTAQVVEGEAADSARAVEDALRPFSSLLSFGDVEGTYLVATEDRAAAEYFLTLPDVQRALPRDIELHWGDEILAQGVRNYNRLYVLEDEAFLTGDQLEDAVAGRDPQFNQSEVQFTFSRAGGRVFARESGAHVGDFLAIVLDGEVMSAPVIRDRIGARGVIEMGQGTPLEEARDLALVLRAGALPARINIIEERTVGPSLGRDSIRQGQLAGIVGIVLVIGMVTFYYRVAGVLAVGALGVYVLLVLGGLAMIDAKLTVPGIAGLILSIGMAVDANVLIFERIREELAAGRATRTAVDEGFGHALSAIVDANITTLITALILYSFGTGPVQGFAVTLSIGIVASFFSALFVTRSFFLAYLSGRKATDPISI